MVSLSEVCEVCRKLGWRCSRETIQKLVILMIIEGVFTSEQLKIISERTFSNSIRAAAKLKLAGVGKSEILSVVRVRL